MTVSIFANFATSQWEAVLLWVGQNEFKLRMSLMLLSKY